MIRFQIPISQPENFSLIWIQFQLFSFNDSLCRFRNLDFKLSGYVEWLVWWKEIPCLCTPTTLSCSFKYDVKYVQWEMYLSSFSSPPLILQLFHVPIFYIYIFQVAYHIKAQWCQRKSFIFDKHVYQVVTEEETRFQILYILWGEWFGCVSGRPSIF